MPDTNSTGRFSDRVENYVKYRPGYPEDVLMFIKQETRLPDGGIVADIGAGTGIFTGLLLNKGYNVYAVEPNKAMRTYAEKLFAGNSIVQFTNGTSEHTLLKDHAVNLIVCAQAFHWFNNAKTRTEFRRILMPDGFVALIWNNRNTTADDFAVEYDDLLKKESNDYKEVNHQNLKGADFKAFFKDGHYTYKDFPNQQVFGFDGLKGRSLSSSYIPQENTAEGEDFLQKLKLLFNRHQQNGSVKFIYKTEVYLGKV